MRIRSYVVARDYGFAPNPFFGFCTLATCKPDIRRASEIDDWVVGTGSKARGRDQNIVFAMRVTETKTFNEYWADPRFGSKKPYLLGSKKVAYGDNIYFKINGVWHQENSHHSLPNGRPNSTNVKHDTKADRVLISNDFVYWGRKGPTIPKAMATRLCKRGQGHRADFDGTFAGTVIAWLRSSSEWGYSGEPLDW